MNPFPHTRTHTHTLSLTHTHIYHSVRKRRLLGREKMRLQSRFEGRCRVGLKGVRSGESSIEQRPDTRICAVQRISHRIS